MIDRVYVVTCVIPYEDERICGVFTTKELALDEMFTLAEQLYSSPHCTKDFVPYLYYETFTYGLDNKMVKEEESFCADTFGLTHERLQAYQKELDS